MAKIFLIRHAESLANTQGIYQGQSYDTDLSQLGRLQAWQAAAKLTGRKVSVLLTSPLKRAYQTAEVIAAALNLSVITDDRLKETDHGDWSFLNDSQIKARWPQEYALWFTRPSQIKFPNGESFAAQTVPRVISWWKDLDKTKNTVVITHENVIQILITHMRGESLDNIWSHRVTNGTVLEYEI